MTLRALCRLEVAGRRVAVGESFEADADNAVRLIRHRRAEAAEPVKAEPTRAHRGQAAE